MIASQVPRALLLDLDDTIIDDTGSVDPSWHEACSLCPDQRLAVEVNVIREWYWSDSARHRVGRLDLAVARREIVLMAFERLGIDDNSLADAIASKYGALRDERTTLIPGAVQSIERFRSEGCKTALLTNGAGPAQRAKIARFKLESLFDEVLVEGEVGYGKPDHRIFRAALRMLNAAAADAWMVGDNLAWDVAPAKAMGICAVWVDAHNRGLPASAPCEPDHIVRSLAHLRLQAN